MCFNCSGQMMSLDPMPETIVALRQAISRERRHLDRRYGKPDTRVFQYERRVGERRTVREALMPIEDDMIIEVTVEENDGMDFEDLTTIREMVTHLRPVDLA
jgi:hypothetical protein